MLPLSTRAHRTPLSTLARTARRLAPLAALLLALPLVACSDGAAGSGDLGSVGILLTDAPSDDFAQILLDVREVVLIGEGDQATLWEGRRKVDLLSLWDHAQLFALGRGVPVGSYKKIRLILEGDIELVFHDGHREHANVPGNGKLDLLSTSRFLVEPGRLLLIQIDMDAKSIHAHETGNGKWKFRPVVRVDVVTRHAPGKLVLLSGTIRRLDVLSSRFLLCDTHPVSTPLPGDERVTRSSAEDDEERIRDFCVAVLVDEETSIFDEDAMPADLGDLSNGDLASVLGRFVVTDERLRLAAEVVQQGGEDAVLRLAGTVASEVDGDDRFILDLAPGQPVSGAAVTVQLQEGTKVFSRRGRELTIDAIQPGVPARVVGALELGGQDPDVLFATVVVIDPDAIIGERRISGRVVGWDPDTSELELQIPDESSVCVAVSDGTGVYLLTRGEDGGLHLDPARPAALVGHDANAFGLPGDRCFDAHTVVGLGSGL